LVQRKTFRAPRQSIDVNIEWYVLIVPPESYN
jgi:hypothetical protein